MSAETIGLGTPAAAPATGELVDRTKVLIIGGSFLEPETMEPLAAFFRISGHDAEIVRGLPTHDPSATSEDYAKAVADRIRGLGSVILMGYSGGSGHMGRALEILEEEDGSHPVKLAVSITGSLGELPSDDQDDPIPRQPRNSERFRAGLVQRTDRMVEFREEDAAETFFNEDPEVGEFIAQLYMGPQYRVPASRMPRRLNTRWLYLYPEHDQVRNLSSVLEVMEYYRDRDDSHGMDLRIIEGTDHGLPITDPAKVWHAVLDYCLRHEVEIIPPVGARSRNYTPAQRQAAHDLPAGTSM